MIRTAIVFSLAIILFSAFQPTKAFALTQPELDGWRSKWEQANVSEYLYEFQRSCFCIGDLTRKAWVHVADDQVVDVTDVETNLPLDSSFFLTVNDIFEDLQAAIDLPAASMSTTFDSTLGYPTDVYIDSIAMVADEEKSYRTGKLVPIPAACDVSTDRLCGGPVIDALGDALRAHVTDRRFDRNQDQAVDTSDMDYLVEVQLKTYFGDANLDGRFNSSDFLQVFQFGQYEDAVVGNSKWSTGDWNGNREFDNSDLILALQRGGYQRELRSAVLAAVPEPRICGMALTGALLWIVRRRPVNHSQL